MTRTFRLPWESLGGLLGSLPPIDDAMAFHDDMISETSRNSSARGTTTSTRNASSAIVTTMAMSLLPSPARLHDPPT